MAFELQHHLQGEDIPEEWRRMLIEQARTLEAILSRLARAVATVSPCGDRAEAQATHLHAVCNEMERVLTALAHQHVTWAHQTAQLIALVSAAPMASQDLHRRVHTMEQVAEILHANLTVARRYLQETRQRITCMTRGEQPPCL